jgi:hypothetical protein
MRPLARFATAMVCITLAGRAHAGGYDTPILYSARHQGMGGTAIGYVDDASSVFHNPAGLARIRSLNLLGGLSLLSGKLTTSPGNPDLENRDGTYPSRTTEPAFSPLFIVAGGYRVARPVAVGLGIYPESIGIRTCWVVPPSTARGSSFSKYRRRWPFAFSTN